MSSISQWATMIVLQRVVVEGLFGSGVHDKLSGLFTRKKGWENVNSVLELKAMAVRGVE